MHHVITNIAYLNNRTSTGQATATPIQHKLFYLNFGGKEINPSLQPRGQWYGREGVVSQQHVAQWANAAAQTHNLTCTLLLSVRDGQLTPEQFVDAMSASDQFESWYLIPHYDTDHDHAHVIAFTQQRLDRKAFEYWKSAIASRLRELEVQTLHSAEREQQKEIELTSTRSLDRGLSW